MEESADPAGRAVPGLTHSSDYGHYSNKARGMRAKKASAALPPEESAGDSQPKPCEASSRSRADRRRWAMLIKRIHHADPLRCPRCGGTMKIIAFIEPRQGDVIRKILQHCGLWQEPAPRPPPPRAPKRPRPGFPLFAPALAEAPAEVDPEFLEHLRYEDLPEPEPPWDD